jgi:hypothetical protein
MGIVEPILIALSAVSFTVSYYSLYVLPKFNCNTGECGCGPTAKEQRRDKISKAVFWVGLILSIGFLSYFEYSKYQSANTSTECTTECAPGSCEETESNTTSWSDTASACCSGDSTNCSK